LLSDDVIRDLLDVSNNSRHLFLGPFDPSFDICDKMRRSMEEVTVV
jgi:hypothetical protein